MATDDKNSTRERSRRKAKIALPGGAGRCPPRGRPATAASSRLALCGVQRPAKPKSDASEVVDAGLQLVRARREHAVLALWARDAAHARVAALVRAAVAACTREQVLEQRLGPRA